MRAGGDPVGKPWVSSGVHGGGAPWVWITPAPSPRGCIPSVMSRVTLTRPDLRGCGMGYAVRVDGDRVVRAAAELAEVGEQLTLAGEALARVLQDVAAASGGAALAGAASLAAHQWHVGIDRIARRGEELARATAQAAEEYLAVESLNTSVWGVGGGTRWAP